MAKNHSAHVPDAAVERSGATIVYRIHSPTPVAGSVRVR
jgi:hypothetical protein